NVWIPNPKVWVQYESDLGERSAVDFENGVVRIQLLIFAAADPYSDEVKAHLEQGVRNLVLAESKDPIEMIRGQESLGSKKGKERQKLLVLEHSPHPLKLDEKPKPNARDPLLLGQIRMSDGRLVSKDILPDYARELVQSKDFKVEKIKGADGNERLAVALEFQLIPEHLEVRAKRYRPIVQDYAEKYSIYPPLIFAVIHTESAFNPRARSGTPAYGLIDAVGASRGSPGCA
ncbi:MAG: hypothetical protein B1H11_08940, partial [Desulfobacteraceae bacterium 4484_190.1]